MPLEDVKFPKKNSKNLLDENMEDFEDDSFEDDDLEDDDVVLEDDDASEEDSEETSDNDTSADSDADSDEVDTKETPKESLSVRANERVRSAVEAKNAARGKLKEEKRTRIDLQNRMINQQEVTVNTSKTFLKNHIDLVKSSLKKAHEEDDHGVTVDLQEKLNKAQLDLAAFESWKKPDLEEFDEKEFEVDVEADKKLYIEEEPSEKLAAAPKPVQDWVAKNPWFTKQKTEKDKERVQEAVLYSAVLEKQGLGMKDPEYFKKIDARLKKLGLADDTEDDVQSSKSSKENNDSDGRKAKNVVQKKKIIQTSQGVNRDTTNSSGKSRTKVTLTKEQQKIADLYGMSYVEYAKEVRKIEDAEKRGDRMVQIDLKR